MRASPAESDAPDPFAEAAAAIRQLQTALQARQSPPPPPLRTPQRLRGLGAGVPPAPPAPS